MNLLSPFRILLLLALVVVTVIGFLIVPAGTDLPVHWNIAGEADGYLPRDLALLMPAIILAGVWLIMIVVLRLQPEARRSAGGYVTQAVLTAITGVFLTIAIATVALGAGAAVSMVQFIAVALAILLLLLGNALPKSQPNGYAGLRIPTTLADPANWQATHRLTGWLAMAAGVVLLVAAFVAPSAQLILWVLACMLVPMIIGTVYSIVRARTRN
jgi:uncharacterized membrane protein